MEMDRNGKTDPAACGVQMKQENVTKKPRVGTDWNELERIALVCVSGARQDATSGLIHLIRAEYGHGLMLIMPHICIKRRGNSLIICHRFN